MERVMEGMTTDTEHAMETKGATDLERVTEDMMTEAEHALETKRAKEDAMTERLNVERMNRRIFLVCLFGCFLANAAFLFQHTVRLGCRLPDYIRQVSARASARRVSDILRPKPCVCALCHPAYSHSSF